MKFFLLNKVLFTAASLVMLIGFGCKPEIDEPGFSTGEADFTKYVAIGDNYTAGFTNGGLTRESQLDSYPAIMARQIAVAGGPATFNQPLFEGNGTGQLHLQSISDDGFPIIRKNRTGLEIRSNNGLYAPCAGPDSVFLLNKFTGDINSLNNLGFPGLKMSLVRAPNLGNATAFTPATLPNFNPYFERVLPDNDSRRYIDVVTQSNPTFFTVWLGLGDLLPFVTTGGVCTARPNRAAYETSLSALLDSLTRNGARGLIANIPDLNTFGFAPGLSVQEQLRRKNNDNSLVLWLAFAAGSVRAEENAFIFYEELEKIGLPDASGRPYGLDSLNPVSNAGSLNHIEYNNFSVSRVAYNEAILAALTKYRNQLFLVDMANLFVNIKGLSAYNGVVYSNDAIRGNFISLDGYSLTPRGSAIVANRFINAINTNFKAAIPRVDVNAYNGTRLP
jgi:hypothetical protein